VIFVFVLSEFLLVLVEDEVNLKVVQVKVVEVHVAGVGCRWSLQVAAAEYRCRVHVQSTCEEYRCRL
jgi:hypothetical protein